MKYQRLIVMADYNYAQDGKVHTRFSELLRCTPGQIDRVIAERAGAARAETESMRFGTERHEIWEDEVKETGLVPSYFGVEWPVSHLEHEFATEVMSGLVIHSRPDLVCADIGIIPDFKTVVDGVNGYEKNLSGYRHKSKQRQLIFYAFQLGLHNYYINKGAFLCEVWDGKREDILDYYVIEFPITPKDISEVLAWVKPRAALLMTAIEENNV